MGRSRKVSRRNRLSEKVMHFKSLAPIVISLVALFVSSLSLFVSQLQPARIHVHPGEFAYVTSKYNNLEFHLYLTFTNSGAALGVVRKVAILIQAPGRSDGYLLQSAYFDKLEKGNYAPDSVAGPIPVDGRRTVSKQILFISARNKSNDRPLTVTGSYRATVLVWAASANEPTISAEFPFVLTDHDLEELEAQRTGKLSETIELHHEQFHRWNARPLDEVEVGTLLRS